MFNPRHSFISTSSATTYPSTLSPPKSIKTPLTPPASPRHPQRLHRSSKRNLRTSASSNALRTINEDARGKVDISGREPVSAPPPQKMVEPVRPVKPAVVESTARPRSQDSSAIRPSSRTSSENTVRTWAQKVSEDNRTAPTRSATAVPTSTDSVKPKASRDRIGDGATSRPASMPVNGLELHTGPISRHTSIEPNVQYERIAKPRKPEPIDVNPRKTESMADEWEKELIQSAKNLRFEPLPDKGKTREVEKDLQWERSGRAHADVDPTREVEDRIRRDAGREIAYPPSRPRAPIRAASNGVTSIHIGVRPRLHPARADSSMSVNQPDGTLYPPIGSPLGPSQTPNLLESSSSSGSRDRLNLVEKAQAEYELWLGKKEEREAGVGQPHDYGTRDWATKGRVPARPSSLSVAGVESSAMAQMRPRPPVQGPPILVRAVSNDRLADEPILVTPNNGSPHPQMVFPDPTHLVEPNVHQQGGRLSVQPSFENLQAGYAPPYGMPPPVHEPIPVQEHPFPQAYQYPYDPSYGYGMDPAMYQHYWSNPSWYAPQYNWNNPYAAANSPGIDYDSRETKVHFDNDPAGNGAGVNDKGAFDPDHPDA